MGKWPKIFKVPDQLNVIIRESDDLYTVYDPVTLYPLCQTAYIGDAEEYIAGFLDCMQGFKYSAHLSVPRFAEDTVAYWCYKAGLDLAYAICRTHQENGGIFE